MATPADPEVEVTVMVDKTKEHPPTPEPTYQGERDIRPVMERLMIERKSVMLRRSSMERRNAKTVHENREAHPAQRTRPSIAPPLMTGENKAEMLRVRKRLEAGWASAPDRAYRPLGTPDLVRPKEFVARVPEDEVIAGGARNIRPEQTDVVSRVGGGAAGVSYPGTAATGLAVAEEEEDLQAFVSNEPRLPDKTIGNGYDVIRQAVDQARMRCLQCRRGASFVDIVNAEHQALQAAARSPRPSPKKKPPTQVQSPARKLLDKAKSSNAMDAPATPKASPARRAASALGNGPQAEEDLIVRDFRAKEKVFLPWHNRRDTALRDITGGHDEQQSASSGRFGREELESQLQLEGGAMITRDLIRSEAAMYLDGAELMGPAGFGDEGFAQPRASAEVDFLEPHPGLDAYYQRWDATRELMNRKLRKDLMNLTAERTAAARAKAQVFDEVTRNATLRLEPEEWRLRSEQQRLRNQLNAVTKHPWYGRLLRVMTQGGRFASPAERHLMEHIKAAIEGGKEFGLREFAELLLSMRKEDFACPEAQRIVLFLKDELGVSSTDLRTLLARHKFPIPFQLMLDEMDAVATTEGLRSRHRGGTMGMPGSGFNAGAALRTAHSIGKMASRSGATFGGANMAMPGDWRSRLDQAALHSGVASRLYTMQVAQQHGVPIGGMTPPSRSESIAQSGMTTPGIGGLGSGRGGRGEAEKPSAFMLEARRAEGRLPGLHTSAKAALA